MNWAAFARVRDLSLAQRWRRWAAAVCAVLDSICFAGLVILLGLLAELLFAAEGGRHGLLLPESAAAESGSATGRLVGQLRTSHGPVTSLAVLLGAGVLLGATRSLCRYAHFRLITAVVADALERLRRAIYRQAYRLGTTEVSGIAAPPAANVFTRDVEGIRGGLLAWLESSVREPTRVVLLLALALMAHWALTSLFLVLAAMGVFLTVRLVRRAKDRSETAKRGAGRRLALLQESLHMIRLTRGYLMESYEQSRFEPHLRQFTQAEARQLRSDAAVGPVAEFAAVLCIAVVAGLAGLNLWFGLLSISDSVILYASLVGLYWLARTLFDQYGRVREGAERAARLFAFLDQHSQLGQVAGARFLSPMTKSLEFTKVRVEEPGQLPLLDRVDLKIPAGNRVAVMGLDERAKRALVYLIPRFLDPTEGQMQIDGQDISLVTLESLRAQVALVLRGELVFNDTVAGNIGCGEPSYGLPHIVDAAKIAHAHHFIQRLPKGYDTLIGTQGENLSISQQFRIALARAILRDPTIVVIEEPEVHLDEDAKSLLDDTMARFARGRTAIFLPHRLSTIRWCDSIVLLHNGRIEAIGNHRDLTLQSELYRHLQYTEFNVFTAR